MADASLMASKAPEPPQTIVLGQFSGIRNTVSEERLQVGELAAAVNVDIDDVGQLRRRRGRTQIHPGRHHSLKRIAGQLLVVREGVLGQLSGDYTFTPLTEVGDDHLDYAAVEKDIYFSSRSVNGKIADGEVLPWGVQDGSGRWVSPVMTPTENLGAISGRVLSAPPLAEILALYKGRIYLAAGPVLWATELYLYDHVDKDKNYVLLEHDITMVEPVDDGLYVGTTENLLFLQGTLAKGMKVSTILSSPVIRGSATTVPYSKVHPLAQTQKIPEGEGPVFMTEAGICLGLDGGQVYNLTQDRLVFPRAVRGAALYREDQGANTYLAVADSAGSPQANARIGDYVDAEIVRASQGG